MTIKDRIKTLAKGRIRLDALEKQLGLANKTISSWEYHQPKLSSLIAVADYFGVSLDYLVGRDPQGGEDAELTARIHRLTESQRQAVDILINGFLAQSPIQKESAIS